MLMSNYATVVSYLKKQGGFQSHVQFSSGDHGLVGTAHGDHHSEVHTWGKEYYVVDQLNNLGHPNQVLLADWSHLPRMSNAICMVFGHLYIDLFAMRANMKLSYVSLVPDPMAWKQDPWHPCDDLSV